MAEYPFIMKQKNNQGQYDTLYPQTLGSQIQGNIQSSQIEGNIPSSQISGNIPSSQITGQFPASQIDDIFTKGQTLTQATATLFGLTTDAVPDEVFQILAQAALYKTVTPTAQLGTLPEGSIIYLSENGSPVPFYVAKQGYEPDYNTDRVLVVRKDAVQTGVWNSTNVNTYNGSTIDTWMNGTYLQTLDSDVQTAIGTTNIPYTPMGGTTTVQRIRKAVFALTGTELGKADSANLNVEGAALPIASTLISTQNEWTRSPVKTVSDGVYYTYANSNITSGSPTQTQYYRPAFTLPTTFEIPLAPTTGLYDVSDNLLLKLPGVQIETGSYIGTGTAGSSNRNSLTFGFEPKLVFINGSVSGASAYFANPAPYASGTENYKLNIITWDGNSIFWYSATADSEYQLNDSGKKYYYITIG